MLDYQGPAYAHLYLQRMEQVLAAERAADPSGARGFATTREMARWRFTMRGSSRIPGT